jgi:hypothetical protein
MDKAQANDLVAQRFSRLMNATTSPLGMVGDPPVVAAATAVLLVAYLAARRSDAAPMLQQVLLVLALVPVGFAILVTFAILGARGKVVAWLAGLPFPLENMNAILNGLGEELEITFKEGVAVPETAALNPKLDAIHPDSFVTDTREQTVVIRIGVVDNKRTPAASNYRRYRRVLDLVERVLVPMHAESAIESVRVK